MHSTYFFYFFYKPKFYLILIEINVRYIKEEVITFLLWLIFIVTDKVGSGNMSTSWRGKAILLYTWHKKKVHKLLLVDLSNCLIGKKNSVWLSLIQFDWDGDSSQIFSAWKYLWCFLNSLFMMLYLPLEFSTSFSEQFFFYFLRVFYIYFFVIEIKYWLSLSL